MCRRWRRVATGSFPAARTITCSCSTSSQEHHRKDADAWLGAGNITVNKKRGPERSAAPMVTSGLPWAPAVTHSRFDAVEVKGRSPAGCRRARCLGEGVIERCALRRACALQTLPVYPEDPASRGGIACIAHFSGTRTRRSPTRASPAKVGRSAARRDCLSCEERLQRPFKRPELLMPQVVKRTTTRTVDEAKLRSGLLRRSRTGRSRARPSRRRAAHLHSSEAWAARSQLRRTIGDLVMEGCVSRRGCFVRFASVYRRFQDVEAFSRRIERMRPSTRRVARRATAAVLPADAGKQEPPPKREVGDRTATPSTIPAGGP